MSYLWLTKRENSILVDVADVTIAIILNGVSYQHKNGDEIFLRKLINIDVSCYLESININVMLL